MNEKKRQRPPSVDWLMKRSQSFGVVLSQIQPIVDGLERGGKKPLLSSCPAGVWTAVSPGYGCVAGVPATCVTSQGGNLDCRQLAQSDESWCLSAGLKAGICPVSHQRDVGGEGGGRGLTRLEHQHQGDKRALAFAPLPEPLQTLSLITGSATLTALNCLSRFVFFSLSPSSNKSR